MRGDALLLQSSNFDMIRLSEEQTIKLFIGVLAHASPRSLCELSVSCLIRLRPHVRFIVPFCPGLVGVASLYSVGKTLLFSCFSPAATTWRASLTGHEKYEIIAPGLAFQYPK